MAFGVNEFALLFQAMSILNPVAAMEWTAEQCLPVEKFPFSPGMPITCRVGVTHQRKHLLIAIGKTKR